MNSAEPFFCILLRITFIKLSVWNRRLLVLSQKIYRFWSDLSPSPFNQHWDIFYSLKGIISHIFSSSEVFCLNSFAPTYGLNLVFQVTLWWREVVYPRVLHPLPLGRDAFTVQVIIFQSRTWFFLEILLMLDANLLGQTTWSTFNLIHMYSE